MDLKKLLGVEKHSLQSLLGVPSPVDKLKKMFGTDEPRQTVQYDYQPNSNSTSDPNAIALNSNNAIGKFLNPMVAQAGITNQQVQDATPATKLGGIAMAVDMAIPQAKGIGLLAKVPGARNYSAVRSSLLEAYDNMKFKYNNTSNKTLKKVYEKQLKSISNKLFRYR